MFLFTVFLLGSPQSRNLPVTQWQFSSFLVFSVRYTVQFTRQHPNITVDYGFITILMGFSWSSLSEHRSVSQMLTSLSSQLTLSNGIIMDSFENFLASL